MLLILEQFITQESIEGSQLKSGLQLQVSVESGTKMVALAIFEQLIIQEKMEAYQ